jgi:nucleoside phosphorylase
MSVEDRPRVLEFLEVLRRLNEELSSIEFSKSFGALADAYDLSAARDEIDRFIRTGDPADFTGAERRISALTARTAIKNRREVNKLLLQLSDIGASLTPTDLRAVPELRQNDMPDGNISVNQTDTADVLVIAAMYDPELTALLPRIVPFKDLVGTTQSGLPDITYFVGSIPRITEAESSPVSVAALFLTRTGLTDCASLVASGIRVFRPRLVAMTGVCAGRRTMKVKKNDIIVPASSFTFDSGKYSESEFEKEPHWADASIRIIQRVRSVDHAILDDAIRQIESTQLARVRRPSVHYDVMACGSSVVDKTGMIDQIAADTHRKVAGLDMESYAFLRSATITDPSVNRIVVKGVMDYSTGKSDTGKARAAFWAAAFLTGLIKMDFDQLVGRQN